MSDIKGDFYIGRLDLPKYGFGNPSTGRPYSPHHIKTLEARGLWPQGYWISPNRRAWKYSELRAHFDNLPRERPSPVRDVAGMDVSSRIRRRSLPA